MKNIYKALANFQQECPTIHKATQGYGYSYSDLPTIFKVINPILKKNGLGFTQLINESSIDTILFHSETGETINSSTVIPTGVQLAKMNDFQVLGSAVTYIRRYALSSMLGVVTDKDIDASGEQKEKVIKQPQKEIKTAKVKINDERFNNALKQIETGNYTEELMCETFELTDAQVEQLREQEVKLILNKKIETKTKTKTKNNGKKK